MTYYPGEDGTYSYQLLIVLINVINIKFGNFKFCRFGLLKIIEPRSEASARLDEITRSRSVER
jgi:hypothetical protein